MIRVRRLEPCLGLLSCLLAAPAATAQCDRLTEYLSPTGNDSASAGTATLGADLDRNGMDELLIGSPGATVQGVNAGAVQFWSGPASSSTTTIEHPAPVAGDRFGAALAVADFDGDTHADIAIGAPGRDDVGQGWTDSGSVFVFYGPTFASWVELTSPSDQANFGGALAAGYLVAGATQPNLVIGAPIETTGGVPGAGVVPRLQRRQPHLAAGRHPHAAEPGRQGAARLLAGDRRHGRRHHPRPRGRGARLHHQRRRRRRRRVLLRRSGERRPGGRAHRPGQG